MSSTGYAIYMRLAVMSRAHPGLSIHAIFMGLDLQSILGVDVILEVEQAVLLLLREGVEES